MDFYDALIKRASQKSKQLYNWVIGTLTLNMVVNVCMKFRETSTLLGLISPICRTKWTFTTLSLIFQTSSFPKKSILMFYIP